MVEQLNLYGAPVGAFGRTLARRTDPDTSHLAAASVIPGLSALEEAIVTQACHSPLSAFVLAERVEAANPGRWDEGTVRSRVSKLEHRGVLAKHDEKATSPRGRVCDTYVLP